MISIKHYRNVRYIPRKILNYCIQHLTLPNGCLKGYVSEYLQQDRKNLRPAVILYLRNKPICWALLDHTDRIQTYTLTKYRRKGYSSLAIMKLIHKYKITKAKFYWNYFIECKTDVFSLEKKFGISTKV